MNKYYIITFKNTHDAISGEEILTQEKINIEVTPTPVFITKSCGISIRVDMNCIDNVKLLIKNNNFQFKNIYLRNENGYKLINF
ncbi:hypothetical protein J2Z42_002722 [Clostridium algifaecis]|uniref:Putative Se/S carrier protein-like domain-containing protein n=1 Tax=Clostridium algifaecis TaxID=1472040 RepID=A0ABS4KVD7_9CLOT|nr:DUF3343 domain-containing protein [Clostridium algifaecis]MBP2034005.1 hypothetical protein [Clostridium algifaecis]